MGGWTARYRKTFVDANARLPLSRLAHASIANGFHGGSFFDAFPAPNTPMPSLYRSYQAIRQEGSPLPNGFASTPRPMPHRARSTQSNGSGVATPPT